MSSYLSSRSAALLAIALSSLAIPAGAAEPMPTETGNAAHDTMARLSPTERNRSLDSVLRSVDQATCDVVQSTFVSYRAGHFATWRATCSDGRRFIVDLFDGPDWSLEVISCDKTVEQKDRCAP